MIKKKNLFISQPPPDQWAKIGFKCDPTIFQNKLTKDRLMQSIFTLLKISYLHCYVDKLTELCVCYIFSVISAVK